MTDNIQEAAVGSGTKVADTKQSEKRAQLTLKAIQLRMKQEKERAAIQQQKKSLSVKEETMTESFNPSQIAALKAEYSKINRIDPSSDTYKKLIAMLDKLDLKSLQSLAGAEIKFVSMLAKNRVMSKSMKKEEVEQIEEDEEMTQKKKEQVVTVKHKDSGKELRIVKTAVADYQKRGYHPVKEELSPKQKEIDKNKNGKIDGFDLAHLRKKTEELSPAQKAIDKNKNNKIDATDLAHLRSKKKLPQGAYFAAQRRKERLATNGRMDEEVKVGDKVSFNHSMTAAPGKTMKKVGIVHKVEDDAVHVKVKSKYGVMTHKKSASELTKEEFELELDEITYDDESVGKSVAENIMDKINLVIRGESSINEKSDYETYHKDYSSAVQTAIKQAEKRGFEVDMDDWDDKVATGPKKPSAGKTNSFSINLMKDGKPSKKKLQMQVYNMDNQKYELNMYIEEVQLDEALRGDGSTHEGEFQEKGHGNWFTYKKTADAWAKKHGLQHEIEVGDHGGVGGLKSTRFGTVKGTVAYIATGEKEGGSPELEKWPLKKHNKYAKWGSRAESVKMTEDEVESIDELNKDTLYSYAKKSEKDQDDQYNKVGKGIRDKDPKSANKAGHKFSMRSIGQNRAEKRLAKEAASPAQQAAIAIAMKKDGKQPKDRLPKKPANEYDRKVVKYLKKKHGMAEGMNDWALKDKPKAKSIPQTSGMNNWARKDIHNKAYDFPPTYYDKDGKDMYGRKKPELKAQAEGIVDKIKAIKRGLEAKAKADDHFDKAMDTKSPDASKHLKKAVRYHNLLNKEEVVLEAKKAKSFKDVKKKMKEEEMPSKSTIKKGDILTGKREPIEINPELKEPAR